MCAPATLMTEKARHLENVMHRRIPLVAAVLLTGALALGGCATPRAGTAPTADQAPLLTARAMVLDDGDGPELCVGGVATSLPPQCGGPRLIGWEWAAVDGAYEEQAGVRWGDFRVIGTYDAAADEFTLVRLGDLSDQDGTSAAAETDFSTPCPEPAGGWRVVDEAATTVESMDAAFSLAATFDDYAASWMDQSPNPAATVKEGADPETREMAMNDPMLSIVNVRVTGDVSAAETALREVWGGMLCVSPATHSAGELDRVLAELTRTVPGILGGGVAGRGDVIDVGVVYDDGSIQRELDAKYGAGLVRVSSALVPVG